MSPSLDPSAGLPEGVVLPQSARELASMLREVPGWLADREAWALHELARTHPSHHESFLVAEIGSYLGRSAIAMGLGLRARGSGRLVTIDPHSEEAHAELLRNLERFGVAADTEALRMGSWAGAKHLPDGSVHLLFVDGDHELGPVLRDLLVWQPKLAAGAVVGINDPFWPAVNRVLREYVFSASSPFRRPWFVQNTIFVEYAPGEWPTIELLDEFERVRRFLRRGMVLHSVDDRPGGLRFPLPRLWRLRAGRITTDRSEKAFLKAVPASLARLPAGFG